MKPRTLFLLKKKSQMTKVGRECIIMLVLVPFLVISLHRTYITIWNPPPPNFNKTLGFSGFPTNFLLGGAGLGGC